MSSSQLSGKEQEDKYDAVTAALTQSCRADIKRDLRAFVMHQTWGGSGSSQIDIAFKVDKIAIIIETLRELANELKKKRGSR